MEMLQRRVCKHLGLAVRLEVRGGDVSELGSEQLDWVVAETEREKRMELDFAGRKLIVIGGTNGIGKPVASLADAKTSGSCLMRPAMVAGAC
jgi:hypothetical protein